MQPIRCAAVLVILAGLVDLAGIRPPRDGPAVQDEDVAHKKLEGLLRKTATQWIVARQNVLRKCTKCEGSGFVLRQVATRRQLQMRKLPCSKCKKAGCTVDTKRLGQLYDAFLPEATTLPGLKGKRLGARDIRRRLASGELADVKERLGYVKERHIRVRKVRVSGGPALVEGVVSFGSKFKPTVWARVDRAWRLVSDDDLERLKKVRASAFTTLTRALAAGRGKGELTVGQGDAAGISVETRTAAKQAMRVLAGIETRFRRAAATLESVKESPDAPTAIRLVVDYGVRRPTPRAHAHDARRLVFDVARVMQTKDWPDGLEHVAITVAPCVIDAGGNIRNARTQTVLLDRASARRVKLAVSTAAAVTRKFWRHEHPMAPGSKIWLAKAVKRARD